MNCFTIDSNDEILFFLNSFYNEIENRYPIVYRNFKVSKAINVSGWPIPKFDLINVEFEHGYDYYHPSNWNKEVINQEGKIDINGKSYAFTFGGHKNIIDHFRMPVRFKNNFKFETIKLESKLELIKTQNRRGFKRFKNLLKKDYREYLKFIKSDEIFLRQINDRTYIGIKEIAQNRYLAFDTNYRGVILNYFKSKIYKRPDSGYIEIIDNSTIDDLDTNINQILKERMEVNDILNLANKSTGI